MERRCLGYVDNVLVVATIPPFGDHDIFVVAQDLNIFYSLEFFSQDIKVIWLIDTNSLDNLLNIICTE